MKPARPLALCAALLAVSSNTLFATEHTHAENPQTPAQQSMPYQPMNPYQMAPQQMPNVPYHQAMQDYMQQLRQTHDPMQRRQLMEQNMSYMQQQMRNMHKMMQQEHMERMQKYQMQRPQPHHQQIDERLTRIENLLQQLVDEKNSETK